MNKPKYQVGDRASSTDKANRAKSLKDLYAKKYSLELTFGEINILLNSLDEAAQNGSSLTRVSAFSSAYNKLEVPFYEHTWAVRDKLQNQNKND